MAVGLYYLYGKGSFPIEKSGETWERVQIKKVPSLSWEKFKIRGRGGGDFGNNKNPMFQMVSKTEKKVPHFILLIIIINLKFKILNKA